MAARDDQPRPLAPAPATGDLLTQVARGDEAAFVKLYDELAPRVYGLCRRIVRDPAQAEEVAQEALVEVWRTAGRYDPAKGSASAWVLTIAHRRAVDRVRAEQASTDRERRVATEEVAELRETATRLADATEVTPPARLKEAVLAEVARTPQARRARAARGGEARWRRWTAAAVAAGIVAIGAAAATYVVEDQRVRDAQAHAAH